MIPYRKIPVSISESEELSMLRARAPTWSCKKLLARYIEACKYMNGETSGYSHPLTSEQKDQLQLNETAVYYVLRRVILSLSVRNTGNKSMDDTYTMTVSTNAGTQTFNIDDIHYFREIFLRNVKQGDSFDRKYRVLKEKAIPLASLKLPSRIQHTLERARINSVQTLLKHNRKSLLAIKGLGEASVDEIAKRLTECGYDAHEIIFPGIPIDEIEAARLNPDSVLNLVSPLSEKLYRAGVKKISELKAMSSEELMRIPGFEYSDFSKIVMAIANTHS